MPVVISYKSTETERGTTLWWVTYDGRILGDDRPFNTETDARAAALAVVVNTPLEGGRRTRIYRPGF